MPTATGRETLRRHVEALAGDIGERNVFRPRALTAAEAFVAEAWRRQGYRVARHVYRARDLRCANLEVTCPGRRRPGEILLVGAHYDSVLGSPGADDNASGVAALLELSRLLAEAEPARTVRFVAFVNEEPPLFATRDMGSEVYAGAARDRGDDIRLMLSLESIGYYRTEPGSQRYPPPLGLCYPDRGDFVAFLANLVSRRALRRAVRAFRAHAEVPVRSLAAPALLPGMAWSDHRSFWRRGYRALMVTDTAPYRSPHYHTAGDTPDTLDYDTLARVVEGLARALAALAAEQDGP